MWGSVRLVTQVLEQENRYEEAIEYAQAELAEIYSYHTSTKVAPSRPAA